MVEGKLAGPSGLDKPDDFKKPADHSGEDPRRDAQQARGHRSSGGGGVAFGKASKLEMGGVLARMDFVLVGFC